MQTSKPHLFIPIWLLIFGDGSTILGDKFELREVS